MSITLNGHSPARLAAYLLSAAALGLGTVVLPAGSAQAASSTTCTGTSTITYSPGLTNTPRTVAYTETDTLGCLSTVLGLTAGLSVTSVSIPGASCNGAGLTTDTPYDITWNTGATSEIDLSFTDAVVAGQEQVTGTGPVTSGLFTGGNATIVWVYPLLNPLTCAGTQGVTSQTGVLTAQITSVS